MTDDPLRQGGVARSSKSATLLILSLLGVWSAVLPSALHYFAPESAVMAGPDGPYSPDQFQYFAWVRESGEHFFAGNQFTIPPGERIFLHPLWFLSGLLWRVGLPIQYTLLPWKVLTVLALCLCVQAYAKQFFPDTFTRTAAVVLGLFYVTPFVVLNALVGQPDSVLLNLSYEALGSVGLWGYPPSGLATALMPLYFLAAERVIRRAGTAVLPSAIGFTIAWLHPWHGATIALATVLLALACRMSKSARPLLIPTIATGVPLLGYLLAARVDPSWGQAHGALQYGTLSVAYTALLLGPILLIAALGLRDPRRSPADLALTVWPIAALVALFVQPSMSVHALAGVSIPLAILSVRGVARFGQPAIGALLLLFCAGDLVQLRYALHQIRGDWHIQHHLLMPDEVQALRFIEEQPDREGVLAPLFMGSPVPAWTGHPVWIGHQVWTPSFAERASETSALFSGALSPADAVQFVRATGAKYVLTGCYDATDAASAIRPITTRIHRFGCATVYEVR